MWLVVGLGNPGNQYSQTRHNIGFMAIDHWNKSRQIFQEQNQFKGLTTKLNLGSESILTLKPQTYMNLSGQSIQEAMAFYKIPQDQLIVIHDEIDQAYGQIKIQKNRGHGGHNGIRNTSEILGSADYIRLRLGVGRPQHPGFAVADYVLQKFNTDEIIQLDSFLNKASQSIEAIITLGHQKAATQFNSGK